MKFLSTIIAALLTVTALAQTPPPVSVRGQQSSTKLLPKWNIQVPNDQATNLGGIDALLETGNNNILANPGFEHSTFSTSWTLTSGTSAVETSTVIHGRKAYKATLSSQTLELYQDSTRYASQFNGSVQGMAYVRVNTTVSGISVCSRNAGTTSSTNCVAVSPTGTWGLYKVPFILSATSNGIAVVSSGNVTGDVYVDEGFVGAIDISSNVDQSRVAGESYFAGTSSCTWSRTSTTVGAFTSTAACPGPTVAYSSMGAWQTTDSDLPRQTINNLPPGVYKAKFIVGVTGNGTNGNAFAINDGTTTCQATYGNSSSSIISPVVECTFTYSSAGNRSFELYTGSTGGAVTIRGDNSASPQISNRFILEYFGSDSVYSEQCGSDLECSNEFSIKVSSTDVISDPSVSGWITGNCTNATTGKATCPFLSGLFTVTPNCFYTNTTTNEGLIESVSTSSVTVNTYTNGSLINGGFTLICQKQGVDYKSRRNIVGSFKEVPIVSGTATPRFYMAIGNCSSSSSFSKQLGGTATSIGNISSGKCDITLPATIFSAVPICVVNFRGDLSSTALRSVTVNPASATSVGMDCTTEAPADCTSFNFSLYCLESSP